MLVECLDRNKRSAKLPLAQHGLQLQTLCVQLLQGSRCGTEARPRSLRDQCRNPDQLRRSSISIVDYFVAVLRLATSPTCSTAHRVTTSELFPRQNITERLCYKQPQQSLAETDGQMVPELVSQFRRTRRFSKNGDRYTSYDNSRMSYIYMGILRGECC